MRRHGYTKAELVVVLIAAAIIFAMMLAALSRSKIAAQSSQCQNNLRQFGTGLLLHASRDSKTRYCTGAYDWKRDGCPDSCGWVADLVNMNVTRPGDLLCPSNPAKANETLNQLYAGISADGDGIPDPQALWKGVCGEAVEHKQGGTFGAASTPARRDAINKSILDKGYTTNYAAHWFLVRGGPKVVVTNVSRTGSKVNGFWIVADTSGGATDWKTYRNTTGPLRKKDVDASKIAANMIPLLGDAAPGNTDEAVSQEQFTCRGRPLVGVGARLVQSFSDGPATWDTGKRKLVQVDCTASRNCRFGAVAGLANSTATPVWTGQIYEEYTDVNYGSVGLQDCRALHCYHSGSCNILMADGSVREFGDADGDGLLNPGFPIDDARFVTIRADTREIPSGGFTGPAEDLPRQDVFSGLFIDNLLTRKTMPLGPGSPP
jgi:prepilin-type processing-associated H-X9-DG protein